MTALTAIPERLARKLAVVGVFVAIQTACEFDFVNRSLAGGNVALAAFYVGVLAFQGIL